MTLFVFGVQYIGKLPVVTDCPGIMFAGGSKLKTEIILKKTGFFTSVKTVTDVNLRLLFYNRRKFTSPAYTSDQKQT